MTNLLGTYMLMGLMGTVGAVAGIAAYVHSNRGVVGAISTERKQGKISDAEAAQRLSDAQLWGMAGGIAGMTLALIVAD